MLFTYLLASVLAMSAVLGRSAGPTSKQLTYTNETHTVMQSDDTVQVMDVDDRSTNLKYVMVIQSSSIWEEIKKRSLTINTPQGLDHTVAEQSLDNLTDQELAQLKQACHDGLKCVAVDQLLVLNQVREPLGDGKMSVLTAITKITQVLTQYTTEYHEDTYQYEAVNQSDDESKVYKSVTTIVEDNKELCHIDLTPEPVESNHKNSDDSSTVPAAADNNSIVNYNTVKNYNINNGTVNSATVNIEPHSVATTDGSSDDSDVNSNYQTTPVAPVNRTPEATDDSTDGKPFTRASKINQQRAQLNQAQDSGTSDRHFIPVATTDDHPNYAQYAGDGRKSDSPQLMITDGPSPRDRVVSEYTGHARKSRQSRPGVTGQTPSVNTDKPAANNKTDLNRSNGNDGSHQIVAKETAGDVNNNTVQLENSSSAGEGGKGRIGSGENDSDTDIASAGAHNNLSSKKGMVEDGILNNGIMKAASYDKSNRNKGIVKGTHADNGVINIGMTNNGPVNYGTSNGYTNNGTMADMENYDIRQYANEINKMYSNILNEFAKE